MSLNIWQVREFVVRPALAYIGMASPAAVQLVMATGDAESGFQFIDQKTSGADKPGPAYGAFQMEGLTHDDIWRWLGFRAELAQKVRQRMILGVSGPEQMQGNMYYAAIMCRLHYARFSEALPELGDIGGMARYWKKYYNTPLGAGTEDGFRHKAARVFMMKD